MGYFPQHVDFVRDALLTAGLERYVRLEFVEGWERRGYQPFDPGGTGMHHDASAKPSPGFELDQQRRLTRMHTVGRPGLSGPICQADLSRFIPDYGRFVLSIIASAAANHPGVGVWRGVSGRARFAGLECMNTGTGSEEWPAIQLQIASAWSAGWLACVGGDSTGQWEHKEYARPVGRKVDRYGLGGDLERAETQLSLDTYHHRPPTPAEPVSMEDGMIVIARFASDGSVWACNPATMTRTHLDGDMYAVWSKVAGEGGAVDVGDVPAFFLGDFDVAGWVMLPDGRVVREGGTIHTGYLLSELEPEPSVRAETSAAGRPPEPEPVGS